MKKLLLQSAFLVFLAYLHGIFAFALAFWGISVFLWPVFYFVEWLDKNTRIHLLSGGFFIPLLILNGLFWVAPLWIAMLKIWNSFGKGVPPQDSSPDKSWPK